MTDSPEALSTPSIRGSDLPTIVTAATSPWRGWHDENEWVIDGHRFSPAGVIPYDPARADEIEASIHYYLDNARSPGP